MFSYNDRGFDPLDPSSMLNARFGRRQSPRFDEYFRCYPIVMAPSAERPELNYGSKIFLPPSALVKVSQLHVQWPLQMELINGEKEKHSHCGVLEFIAEEGRAYIPQWMMETLGLDVGDMVQARSTSLKLASMVRLQPQSTNFLDISDPRAVLEKAFRNFATVTKGDVFAFEYNDDIYRVAVLEVEPESEKMGVSMIETDVTVEFAAPVGYVEPPRQPRGSGTSTPASAKSSAVPSGGLLRHQGTMAAAINYNAIAPSAVVAAPTSFLGEGRRLNSKKGAAGTSSTSVPPTAPTDRGQPSNKNSSSSNNNSRRTRKIDSPMPLRLASNKLFFGYEIKPLRDQANEGQKEGEKEDGKRQTFAGQGQTLRGAKKGSDKDNPAVS